MSGVNIVGVQFRRAGKIYDFDARDFCLSIGDRVVVETERGPSLAEVKRVSYQEIDELEPSVLKPIVRIASGKDQDIAGRLLPEQAESFTKQKIYDLELDMRVIGVEIQFGGNKVIVYFSAPGRVDFRELVKELAGGLKTRVELKQVGSRDEAKLSGGLGICGREFCCSSFLREFVPVSIKMAKNQNLALNPSKVSGGCGRLLCCLTYEDETYSSLRQQLLPKGARVKLREGGFGDVLRGDILNQTMLVELDSGEQKSIPIVELEVVDSRQAVNDEDDWGADLDLGNLMGDGDIAALDDSEEVKRQRSEGSSKQVLAPRARPIPVAKHHSSGEQRPAGERPRRPSRTDPREYGESLEKDNLGSEKEHKITVRSRSDESAEKTVRKEGRSQRSSMPKANKKAQPAPRVIDSPGDSPKLAARPIQPIRAHEKVGIETDEVPKIKIMPAIIPKKDSGSSSGSENEEN